MDKKVPIEGGIELDGLITLVKRIIDSFIKEEIDYAFTGAFAASYYGVQGPLRISMFLCRSLQKTQIKLASALRQTGLEVDEKKIDYATTSGYRIGSFKSKSSPYKVDVILSDRVRKRSGNINGVDTFFQAPEDLISAKLRMIKAPIQKERKLRDEEDVKAILRFTNLDKDAIQKQAKKDKTGVIWRRLSSC